MKTYKVTKSNGQSKQVACPTIGGILTTPTGHLFTTTEIVASAGLSQSEVAQIKTVKFNALPEKLQGLALRIGMNPCGTEVIDVESERREMQKRRDAETEAKYEFLRSHGYTVMTEAVADPLGNDRNEGINKTTIIRDPDGKTVDMESALEVIETTDESDIEESVESEIYEDTKEVFWSDYELPALHLRKDGFHQGDASDEEVAMIANRYGWNINEVCANLTGKFNEFLQSEQWAAERFGKW